MINARAGSWETENVQRSQADRDATPRRPQNKHPYGAGCRSVWQARAKTTHLESICLQFGDGVLRAVVPVEGQPLLAAAATTTATATAIKNRAQVGSALTLTSRVQL